MKQRRIVPVLMIAGLISTELTTRLSAQVRISPVYQPGYVPTACGGLKGTNQFIDCYLTYSPAIANSIVFRFDAASGAKAWPQWDNASKQAVRDAYKNALDWYAGGMSSYAGPLAPDPPPNLNDAMLVAGQPAYITFSQQDAWTIYTGHVGLILAAEINAWVSWSIRNYSSQSLDHLLNAVLAKDSQGFNNVTMFWPSGAVPTFSGTPGYVSFSGAPANATKVFKFMKDNNLIGATPKETIGRVLGWSSQLHHSFCGWDGPQILYAYWQYYAGPTVSGMLDGTIYNGPGQCGILNAGVKHYTTGCGGTVGLWKWMLRVVNIPVSGEVILTEPGAGHGGAWFPSIDAYISHGDSPYDNFAAGYNPQDLLLAPATFSAWFPTGDFAAAQKNIDRRVTTLAINYPGPSLISYYCQDVMNGKSHASGQVYQCFQPLFTVSQLEQLGLWTKLAAASNGCAAP